MNNRKGALYDNILQRQLDHTRVGCSNRHLTSWYSNLAPDVSQGDRSLS